MAYDPNKLTEMKTGTREKTRIISIEEGKQGELRPDTYWENIKNMSKEELREMKNKSCIKIRTENNATLIMNLPNEKGVHPRSSLALFKKKYGSYPKVGMEVETEIDENGFNRIVL